MYCFRLLYEAKENFTEQFPANRRETQFSSHYNPLYFSFFRLCGSSSTAVQNKGVEMGQTQNRDL
jgi:hypothetical protein